MRHSGVGFRVVDSTQNRQFDALRIKVGNLGVMHKIRLEGDHQTLTFGVVQLVVAMQPGGAKVNISRGFWVKGALFRFFEAFGA